MATWLQVKKCGNLGGGDEPQPTAGDHEQAGSFLQA